MIRHVAAIAAAVSAVAGCGGKDRPSGGYGYTLEARGGIYDDGSGRPGVAVLATLRDGTGAGPSSAWSGGVTGPGAAFPGTLSYDAPGGGSYALWAWSDVAPAAGGYDLALGPAGAAPVHASFALASGGGLSLPQPAVATDASSLSWPPVAGAASYACEVRAGGAVQLAAVVRTQACDLSALPPGAYAASVRAYSADLVALASAPWTAPPLPDAFDVAEARLAFVKPGDGAPAVRLVAAGGAYDFGMSSRTLAVWLSITQADGTPTADRWDVEVVGPGLPPSAPFAFTYWANFPREMVWSYEVPAVSGTYALTASSGTTAVSVPFTIGDPPALDLPLDLVAHDGAQGSATATWTAVPGARAYLVSAYDGVTGAFVTSAWFAGPSASFPQGTFTAGTAYDVYVAATDADMLGGAAPTQVSVSENLLGPASFVAR